MGRGLTRRRFVATGGAALAAVYATGGRRGRAGRAGGLRPARAVGAGRDPRRPLGDPAHLRRQPAGRVPAAGLQRRARPAVADRPVAPPRARPALRRARPRRTSSRTAPRACSSTAATSRASTRPTATTPRQIAAAFAAGVNAYIDEIERGGRAAAGRVRGARVPARALGARGRRADPQPRTGLQPRRIRSSARSSCARSAARRRRCASGSSRRWRYEVPDGPRPRRHPRGRARRLRPRDRARRVRRAGGRRGSAAARAAGLEQLDDRRPAHERRAGRSSPTTRTAPRACPRCATSRTSWRPGLNVIGAGEPALPGISIGHNRAHRLRPDDLRDRPGGPLRLRDATRATPGEYRYGDGFEPMTVIEEDIPVKDAAPERVTAAVHAPRPGDRGRRDQAAAFAVRSVWFEPGTSAYFASISYMRARNWDRVPGRPAPLGRAGREPGLRRHVRPHRLAAVRAHAGPAQLGRAAARPRRRALRVGRLPRPGPAPGRARPGPRLDRDRQRGEPPARLSVPPPEDRLRVGRAVPAAPHPVGAAPDATGGTRGRLAAAAESTTARSRRRGSCRSWPDLEPADRRTARAIRLLRRWDRRLDPDSAAAALFEVWNVIELPTAVLRAALGDQDAVDAIWPGDPVVLLELLEHPDRRLGRHPRRTRDRVLLDEPRALRSTAPRRCSGAAGRAGRGAPARGGLRASDRTGGRTRSWRRRLSVGPVPVGGGGETVGDTGYSTDGPPEGEEATRAFFAVASGASFRQVIDVGGLGSLDHHEQPRSVGRPREPRTTSDLIGRWAKGRGMPMLFTRGRVEAATELQITCTPGRASRRARARGRAPAHRSATASAAAALAVEPVLRTRHAEGGDARAALAHGYGDADEAVLELALGDRVACARTAAQLPRRARAGRRACDRCSASSAVRTGATAS